MVLQAKEGINVSQLAWLTPEHLVRWPLHTHPHDEIMYYLEGNGALETGEVPIPFHPGRFWPFRPECATAPRRRAASGTFR